MLNKNLIHVKDDKWVDPSKITMIEPVGNGVQLGCFGCFIYFDEMTVDQFMKLVSKD